MNSMPATGVRSSLFAGLFFLLTVMSASDREVPAEPSVDADSNARIAYNGVLAKNFSLPKSLQFSTFFDPYARGKNSLLRRAEIHFGESLKTGYANTLYLSDANGELVREHKKLMHNFGSHEPFLLEGVVLGVHPKNPLLDLSREDALRFLRGEVPHWNDFGKKTRMHVYVLRADDSDPVKPAVKLARSAAVYEASSVPPANVAPEEQKDKPLYFETTDANALFRAVSEDENAVAVLPITYFNTKSVKVLSVEKTKPTPDAILDGAYPLGREILLLAVPRTESIQTPEGVLWLPDAEGLLRKYVEFLKSADAARALLDAGFIPLTQPGAPIRKGKNEENPASLKKEL